MILKWFLPVIIVIIFGGCSNKSYSPESTVAKDMSEKTSSISSNDEIAITDKKISTTNNESPDTPDNKIPTKIIKTANISVETDNYLESRQKLDVAIKNQNAYITQENENKYGNDRITNTLIIRVQKEKFDNLINDISGIGKNVDSKNITSDDVTEEYVDIDARLKNKKEVEKQYSELLKRANTVDDILKVNEHLRIVREEIESREGRMKFIDNRVSLSTINLTIYQNLKTDYGFFSKLVQGLQGGWQGLLGFVIGLAYTWPFLIFLAILIYFIYRHTKKRKEKNNNQITNK